MKRLHISADCESLSLQENPALLAIGAVLFDPYGDDTVETLRAAPCFNVLISTLYQVEAFGRHIDGETVMWWLQQSDAARRQLTSGVRDSLSPALCNFRSWIDGLGSPKTTCLWTHGAAEDAVWLRSAYRAASLPFPIHYRNIRDTRSIFDLMDTPEIVVPGLTDHVALDDAIYQALRIQHAYKQLSQLKEAA